MSHAVWIIPPLYEAHYNVRIWSCLIVSLVWNSRGNIDGMHYLVPSKSLHSLNFLYLFSLFPRHFHVHSSVPPHHPVSCLLFQPTPHLLLHLLTEADNEPRWAVIGFHGISRGLSTHSHTQTVVHFIVVSGADLWEGDFPPSGVHSINSSAGEIIFSNILFNSELSLHGAACNYEWISSVNKLQLLFMMT